MKKVVLTLLSLALVIAQSCTTKDEENLGAESKSEFANKNDLYIDREPVSISTVDANKMATLFKGVTPTLALLRRMMSRPFPTALAASLWCMS